MAVNNEDLIQYRKMLFSIAYNMLGTISGAEDMVQETYVSWIESDKSHVADMKFYLIRTITNKCITHLKNISKQREAYIGTWLPEPIVSDPHTDPDSLKDKLSIGFMYLLEKLTPMERGIIILREAFDLSYREISDIFGVTEENCRQQLSRAKKKLVLKNQKFTPAPAENEKIMRAFISACEERNIDKLVKILHTDVAAFADGGGKAQAMIKPLYGRESILKLMIGSIEWYQNYERRYLTINGGSGVAFYADDQSTVPSALIAFETDAEEKIINIYYIANPDKLRGL